MFKVVGLSCERQDRILFENLNFTVEHGTLIHVAGVNGAGKTTLLRSIAGLHQPAQGYIEFEPLSRDVASIEYRRDILYIGHKLGLNSMLSAIDNLRFWCGLQNVQQPDDFYSLLALLGLVGLEDIPIKQLSAGQQRKVALAKLWLKPTALWILDEPFTALDNSGVEIITAKIEEHIQSGSSVVMTSHQSLPARLRYDSITLDYQL